MNNAKRDGKMNQNLLNIN